jgi:L-lysine exporter family protein LysE/ArgO
LLQASLIFALGAQNLYVLESGLRKQHHIAVSFTCFFCDMSIIMMGVMGMATLLESYPEIKIIFGVLGVGFLSHYAVEKLRIREVDIIYKDSLEYKTTIKKSIQRAATFSVINPHAYLDGIILIGGYSSKYSDFSDRILVGLGASIYSLIWFLILSNASSTMKHWLGNPKRMRIVMAGSGAILLILSLKLSLDVYGWLLEIWDSDPSIASQ